MEQISCEKRNIIDDDRQLKHELELQKELFKNSERLRKWMDNFNAHWGPF